MYYHNILLEDKDGVALLTLNRPEALNALSLDLLEETRDAVGQVAQNPGVKALIITGNGRGFCAGADLMDLRLSEDQSELSVGEMVSEAMKQYFNPLIVDIDCMKKPVINAVNGVAGGGGVGLALAADIVVAARSASFMLTFGPQLGIVPDLGATWFLPRLIGRSKAMSLSFFGDRVSAEQAEQWGMIYKCVDDETLMDEAMRIAKQLADGPTKAWDYIKRAFRESEKNNLEEQLDFERYCQLILCDSEDFMEGVVAFREKRKPQFKGR